MTQTYKVKCYGVNGELDHEEPCFTLEQANEIRESWVYIMDAQSQNEQGPIRYPTIWRREKDGWALAE